MKLPPAAPDAAGSITLIQDKAEELGISLPTLRLWHAEWNDSGYDPEYVIRRRNAGWLRTKVLRRQIAGKQHRRDCGSTVGTRDHRSHGLGQVSEAY